MKNIRTIAMYLPQFHQIPENDQWWGEGFTEWQAVKKAEPLFETHVQPRKPLGNRYYNLLEKDTMKWQSDLAKEYMIDGFCFYHYWFEKGRRVLEKPAENLLQWTDIDMPFCFSWANESWIRTWENVTEGNVWAEKFDIMNRQIPDWNGILLKQDYGKEADWKEHFNYLLPFFLDKRYIKMNGKPVFIIYKPEHFQNKLNPMLSCWKTWAKENGLKGLYIIGAQCAVNSDTKWPQMDARVKHGPAVCLANETRVGNTRFFDYDFLWRRFLGMEGNEGEKTYYCGFVNFDSSPRQGDHALIFNNASPHKFEKYFEQLIQKNIRLGNELVFINAWNEWGEGMYLEPDEENGFGYLVAVRDVMKRYKMIDLNVTNKEMIRPVDIIVPIYNALAEVKKCVESLKRYTDLRCHRLLLLNDSSTDERMLPYLESIENESIIVFNNEKNLGFSANINQGINFSNRDVVLLNSDTVVTKGWLDKLILCAYGEESIATVTPLSNNATIFSVPEYGQDNRLPEGYTVDKYAELVEACSMKRYVTVPTAHGYCMYVKRSVIDAIGVLDDVAFERGYGEENDFCYRAGQAGYHDVMCDDTFIYHSGTSSFLTDEKAEYIQKHVEIIKERYSIQFGVTDEYCPKNPNWDIHENVKLQACLARKERTNILYLLHADFRDDASDHVGGVQLHVKDLVENFRIKDNIIVAARDRDFLNVTIYTDNDEYVYKINIGQVANFPEFRSNKYFDIYMMLLKALRIQCVHVHHTLGLSLEIFYAAQELKIPVVATIHDYFYICPNIKLLDCNDIPCHNAADRQRCSACLRKTHQILEMTDYIPRWRSENEKALNSCKKLFVPSKAAKRIISQYFPNLSNRLMVIEHGSQIEKYSNLVEGRPHNSKFRVAFVGGLSVAKGAKYAYEMIKNSGKDIDWYIFGNLGYTPLEQLQQDNLLKTGQYCREDLPKLLHEYQIDLICILPIWPETFCYTVSEALLSRVPVLVLDNGAVGDRVRSMECGWILPKDSDYSAILKKIVEIRADNQEYNKVLKKIYSLKLKSIEQMCVEYNEIYADIAAEKMSCNPNSIKCFYDLQRAHRQDIAQRSKVIKETELRIKKWQDEKEAVILEQSRSIQLLQQEVKIFKTRSDKFVGYFELFDRWLSKKNQGGGLESYFIAHQYQTIAIYGMGVVGKHLYRELCDSDIIVKYAIDKKMVEFGTKLPMLVLGEKLPKVDVIVVTATFAYEEIKKELETFTADRIISIDDVLLDEKE